MMCGYKGTRGKMFYSPRRTCLRPEEMLLLCVRKVKQVAPKTIQYLCSGKMNRSSIHLPGITAQRASIGCISLTIMAWKTFEMRLFSGGNDLGRKISDFPVLPNQAIVAQGHSWRSLHHVHWRSEPLRYPTTLAKKKINKKNRRRKKSKKRKQERSSRSQNLNNKHIYRTDPPGNLLICWFFYSASHWREILSASLSRGQGLVQYIWVLILGFLSAQAVSN